MITLNVGKRVRGAMGATECRLSSNDIIEELERAHFTVVKTRSIVREPDDEDTLVAVVLDDLMDGTARARLFTVSIRLRQDCIAFAVNFGEQGHFAGSLVGPGAFKWGPFNPSHFSTWNEHKQVEVLGVAFKEAA